MLKSQNVSRSENYSQSTKKVIQNMLFSIFTYNIYLVSIPYPVRIHVFGILKTNKTKKNCYFFLYVTNVM